MAKSTRETSKTSSPRTSEVFTHVHWFAGIGGWALALRLAGWPDDRPLWTGSCPCQPFSAAGKQKGGADDRHLWPHWARLIRECRPDTIVGEQVASAVAHGWLDAVFDDLEGLSYACGAACLPAASVGAPHLRQRVWFVAESQPQHDSGRGAGTRRRLKPTDNGYPGCGCWSPEAFHRSVGMYPDETLFQRWPRGRRRIRLRGAAQRPS